MLMSVLIVLLLVDNIMGVSFYYNSEKKVMHLRQISTLMADSSLDSYTREHLRIMKNDVIKRVNIRDYIFGSITRFYNSAPTKSNNSSVTTNERNIFWHTLSSGGIFILVFLVLVPTIVLFNKEMAINDKIITMFTLFLVLGFGAWFYSWLLSFIPRLGDTWIANYLLNIVLQAVLCIIFIYADKKSKLTFNQASNKLK
jgi:uncharacterized membrane-anchored protein